MLDENPVTEPKRPCKFGPTLLGSPATVVWHEAQRALNNLAPASALPGSLICDDDTVIYMSVPMKDKKNR